MRLLSRLRDTLAQFIPQLREKDPVGDFARMIAPVFRGDPKGRAKFVADFRKELEERKAALAEAKRISSLLQTAKEGGSIPDEDREFLRERVGSWRESLEALLPKSAEAEVSSAVFRSALGLWRDIKVYYEALGWEMMPGSRLSALAEAALRTAARKAIETKERIGKEHQPAMSAVLRSQESYGYELSDDVLRLAAQARTFLLRLNGQDEAIVDPRLAWRNKPSDRAATIEALKDLPIDAVKAALAEVELSADETKAVVLSACSRTFWRAGNLRTVLNDENPFAARYGHQILAMLKQAMALAEEFGVEFDTHETKDVPTYEARLIVLGTFIADPEREGVPPVRRSTVISALGMLDVIDLKTALTRVKLDPPLSSDEIRRAVLASAERQATKYVQELEEQNEKLAKHVVAVEKGEKSEELTNPAASVEYGASYETILSITLDFASSHEVGLNMDLLTRMVNAQSRFHEMAEQIARLEAAEQPAPPPS
jgi:hypothetical protein